MKTTLITTLSVLLFTLSLNAQVTELWSNNSKVKLDAPISAIAEDSCVYIGDTDTIDYSFAGEDLPAIAGGTGLLLKHNADGSEAWGISFYGGSLVSHVVATDDNGVIVAGRFTGEIDVISTDGNDITLTKDDITGTLPFAFIAKYDAEGIVAWAKAFEMITPADAWDPSLFEIADLKVKDNKVLFTGRTEASFEYNDSIYTPFSTVLDFGGGFLYETIHASMYAMVVNGDNGEIENVIYKNVLAGDDTQSSLAGKSIDLDTNGNIIIISDLRGDIINGTDTVLVGRNYDGGAEKSIVISKYNSNGVELTTKMITNKLIASGFTQNDIKTSSINVITENKSIITGQFTGVFMLTTTDSLVADTGNLDSDDNFLLVIENDTISSFQSFGSSEDDDAAELAFSGDTLYVAGHYEDGFTIGNNTVLNTENVDIYLAKFDLDGELINITNSVSDSITAMADVSVTSNGVTAIIGAQGSAVSFDNITMAGTGAEFELFTMVFGTKAAPTTGILTPKADTGISFYPNPANSNITVDACDYIHIYSIAGVEVLSQAYSSSVNISELTNGLYMVKMTKGNSSSIQKLIKE